MTNVSDSAIINVELLATCGALGYFDDGTYLKEPDCLESLKDLIRYLRRDDEAHDIRRQLGEVNVLQTDLIPILKHYSEDNILFDVTLRLLVNLTNPVMLLYHEELPEEKVTRRYYLQIVSHLQKYKQACVDSMLWEVISKKLTSILEKDWTNRQEEDKLIIERILILLRNILQVPANPDEERRTDDDVSIHDQVIWALHKTAMLDLLIYIAASEDEQDFSFHVLEIISHILREQTPQQLAEAGNVRSKSEKEKDTRELEAIRARELAIKKTNLITPSRHPRFGGTFYIKNMKSISDRDMICHRPLVNLNSTNFDSQKKLRRIAKNKVPMQDANLQRRSTLSIRKCLKELGTDFLNNAYNPLMVTVKDQLTRRRAQDHDETYYLWAMRFFMEFNRLHEFDIARVSETVSVQTFHYIHTQLETYYDSMVTEKKKVRVWSRRMHVALNAYKEMLTSLMAMENSKDLKVKDSAKILKGNIFYVVEYRDLLLHLLMNYDEVKFSKSYLRDLVYSAHVFLKMLESSCKNHRTLIVQNKKKTKKKRQNKKKAPSSATVELNEEQLEQMWDDVADSVSLALRPRDEEPMDVQPFDAASEKSMEDQRADAVIKIQDALRGNRSEEAIALFRASRQVWPEDDVFGSSTIEPNEEFMSLREVFFANLPRPEPRMAPPMEEDHRSDGGSDNEPETPREKVSEQAFDFMEFLRRFASPRVVQPYVLLLRQYEKNDRQTNHCLLRMMHRIAWDCKMYGLFFQASVFRIFQRILVDPNRNITPDVKEMGRFAVFIIRKFFENAEKNKKIFMEILFWKNSKEVFEIDEGYGSFDKKNKSTILWTEEQEEELMSLYAQYKDVHEEGKDVVDLILEHMIDASKTRRQVIRQLKVQSLLAADDKLRNNKAVRTRPPTEWREEEIAQLHTLYQEYKDSSDVMSFLMDGLSTRRPKHRVIEKLMQLGIVQDRKALYKKRARKNGEGGRRKRTNGSADDNESGVESASESEREIEDSSSESDVEPEPEKPLDLASLKDTFSSVLGPELQPGIMWLKLALVSVAEDREDGEEPEPSPLVPLQEAHHNAMQSQEFQNLLKSIGIKPPANEQESFWRIPVELTAAALRVRVQVLEKAESGNLGSAALDSLAAAPTREKADKKTSKQKRSHSEKKEKEHRKPKRTKPVRDADIEESVEMSHLPQKKRRKIVLDDSDAEDEPNSSRVGGGDKEAEEAEEEEAMSEGDVEQHQENKHLSDDGEDEVVRKTNPIKKRSRILDDSDSSENERDESWNDEMKDLTAEERGRDGTSGVCNFNSDDDDEPLFSKMKRKQADEKQKTSIGVSQDVSRVDEEAPLEDSDVEDRRSNSVKRIRQRIIESDDED